jgi:hypothetical protein
MSATLPITKKCKDGGILAIEEKDTIVDKSLSRENRIQVVQSACFTHKDSLENLVSKDCSFFRRSILKPGKFLTVCFKRRKSPLFLAPSYPNFNAASKFKCSCNSVQLSQLSTSQFAFHMYSFNFLLPLSNNSSFHSAFCFRTN